MNVTVTVNTDNNTDNIGTEINLAAFLANAGKRLSERSWVQERVSRRGEGRPFPYKVWRQAVIDRAACGPQAAEMCAHLWVFAHRAGLCADLTAKFASWLHEATPTKRGNQSPYWPAPRDALNLWRAGVRAEVLGKLQDNCYDKLCQWLVQCASPKAVHRRLFVAVRLRRIGLMAEYLRWRDAWALTRMSTAFLRWAQERERQECAAREAWWRKDTPFHGLSPSGARIIRWDWLGEQHRVWQTVPHAEFKEARIQSRDWKPIPVLIASYVSERDAARREEERQWEMAELRRRIEGLERDLRIANRRVEEEGQRHARTREERDRLQARIRPPLPPLPPNVAHRAALDPALAEALRGLQAGLAGLVQEPRPSAPLPRGNGGLAPDLAVANASPASEDTREGLVPDLGEEAPRPDASDVEACLIAPELD